MQMPELVLQGLELLVTEFLEIHEVRPRALHAPEELVELEVDRLGVAVLGVLNQKDHEEGDDRRARVDHELPGVRKMKQGPGHEPEQDDGDCREKHPEASGRLGGSTRKAME